MFVFCLRVRKDYLLQVKLFDLLLSPVPPVIIDNMTSTDMVVREGTNVTMVCRATGYPEPYVMWRREDGQEFNCNGESGEIFHLLIILDKCFYDNDFGLI